jgi:hypothetical protein
MAQITYRANLSAKSFPFVSENFGRSVIVAQYDQNYNKLLSAGSTASPDEDRDIGVPQLYYCHNVMPHEQGTQSIGFTDILPGVSGVTDFSEIFLLRDSADNKAYLGVKGNGDFYISDGTGAPWVFKQSGVAGKLVTVAYVSGLTYIYVANTGCYIYDFAGGSFVPATLLGLVAANITGICHSYGYMVAWSTTNVAWSSTINPLDFVPSLVTGAGGGAVESARGAINYCIPFLQGFIVGTADNCVVALYQNNSQYPFIFREIVNSGGMTDLNLVDVDPNSSNLYAYTTSGMQLVSSTQTQTVFPEITDFISGRYFEDFDDATKSFSTVVLSAPMKKKLAILADRYLVMSYGIFELTHAIVYDFTLKRYGKIKINHVEAFTYHIATSGILETPRQSLGFLKKDGSVSVVDFSIAAPASNGTAIFGKYQFVRPRMLQLDMIELESVRQTQSFALTTMASLDGKNTTMTTPVLSYSSGLTRTYMDRAIGKNISLLAQGGFMLDSLILTFNIHGKR